MTEPVKIGSSDGGGVGIVDDERCPKCYHDGHGDQPCPDSVCACEGAE